MTEPTKQREGDQPLPIVNNLPFVQDAVIADIEARKRVGIERYGTPLQAFNGRDALQDAYEEAIDLSMYLKQLIIERAEVTPLPPLGHRARPLESGEHQA